MRFHASVAVYACALVAPDLCAQSLFASQVVSYSQGPGGGIFDTQNVLGGPLGAGPSAGSLDVLTLGEGGSVTLGFDVVIRDGSGADFSVFENGFFVGGDGNVFAEIAFVEVSTDGVSFARFPTSYAAPAGGGTLPGTFAGFAGGTPVIADVSTDPASPFDPVTSGGEAFDLADLAADPLVLSGDVDLERVRFVRLTDVLDGGQETDSAGTPIETFGSADFDAVAVLHHGQESAGGPICDLSVDAQGFVELALGDPDGFFDLDFASFHASVSLSPLPLTLLLAILQPVTFDGNVLVLRSLIPLTGITELVFAVSVRDLAGGQSGDQVALQS